MTPEFLRTVATIWLAIAHESEHASSLLKVGGAPTRLVDEAFAVAFRAHQLARQLEELAVNAAPMPGRD